jgi:hypothetical protein
LNCEFDFYETIYKKNYACIGKNRNLTLKNRFITEVTGDHKYRKTNEDVKQFVVQKGNLTYLPLNLGQFFPNIEIIDIGNSNVQHLVNGDLTD